MQMITDAAISQQLERIAYAVENIERMIGIYINAETEIDLTKP